jgi:predicted lipid-binding transport protein (Tim44 family)
MRNALSGAAGFFAGGLLGRLLFGGFGYGGYQSPFGFGFLELLLVGLGAYFLLRFVRSHQPVPALAGASATAVGAAPVAMAVPVRPAGASDVSVGVGHIRQADPRFNVEALADQARAMYSCVQAGLAMRDMGMIRNRLTPEAYVALQAQCDQLRAARRSNHVEKIDIERAELTEAWQEGGRDYVTVYLAGSLLDYTTEDASPDRVVEGSKDEAQRFEEFWTYTRPSGANPWRLSAIQTG